MLNLIIKSVFTLSYDSVKRLSRFVIIVFLIFYPHFRGLAKDQIHQFFIRSYLSHHDLSEWKHKTILSTCRLWNYFRLIKCRSQPLRVTLIDSQLLNWHFNLDYNNQIHLQMWSKQLTWRSFFSANNRWYPSACDFHIFWRTFIAECRILAFLLIYGVI